MELTRFFFQVVNHFAQVVWKGAHKIGCARGGLYGEPWYVAHYDKAPLIGEPITIENIGKPKQVKFCFRHKSLKVSLLSVKIQNLKNSKVSEVNTLQ